MTERYRRVGMVARWKPVHLGHAAVLRALCKQSERVLVGIGSANRYNARNPFTVEETEEMIRRVLAQFDNYQTVRVPDLDDGPRWREMMVGLFGPLDVFVTDNPYVTSLLRHDYIVKRPVEMVQEDAHMPIDGTLVRREMARGDGWRTLVPAEVVELIVERGLDRRFRQEFGLATLALDAPE